MITPCPPPCLGSDGMLLREIRGAGRQSSPHETPSEPFPIRLAVLCVLLFPLAYALGYMFRELAAL